MKSNLMPIVALSLSIVSCNAFAQTHPMSIPSWEATPKKVKSSTGLLLEGDVVFWKAEEEGLDTCVKQLTAAASPSNAIGKAAIEKGKSDWAPGCKLSIGYLSNYDLWAFKLKWTRFHPDSIKNTVNASSSLGLYQAEFGKSPNNPTLYNTFTSKWTLNYDTLDFVFNRAFSVTKYLVFSPQMGVQAALIRQKYVPIGFFGASNYLKNKLKNNFWGLGLTGGLGTNWRFSPHFGLYGNAMGSLLWGPFKVKQHASGNFVRPNQTTPLVTTKRSFHAMQCALDLEMGLAVNYSFWKDKIDCTLKFGWEEAVWFNQNQFYGNSSYSDVSFFTTHGDLGLSGFVLGLQLKL